MRCSKDGKYLSPYIDGELGAKEVVRLESHLAQCDRCSKDLVEMRRLSGLFSNAERFSAPPGLRSSVMERVRGPSAKGFSLIPFFTGFAETVAVLLAITAGVMSGGLLINNLVPHHKGEQIVSSLSLESFEELPPDSLGRAYLVMTEERR
jgi:anti-sigma factor RsiW